MNYQEWEKTVPPAISGDPLWKMKVYRLALFAADIAWQDVTKLLNDKRTISLSDQLYRALGSVSANIAEGIVVAPTKTGYAFMNMRLVQPVRLVIGIIKRATS